MKKLFLFVFLLVWQPQGIPVPDAPFSAERQDDWIIIGPGGGGSQFTVTISPHDPARVLVRCDMTGAYITHNAGKSWRMFNLRSPARFFAFDPNDPDTIYAQTIGLFRSRNAGETWELVDPDPTRVTGIEYKGDHAREAFLTGTEMFRPLRAFSVDPCNSQVLYGSRDDEKGSILVVSKDGGKTWEELRKVEDRVSKIFVRPCNPGQNPRLYLTGERSVSRFEAGGLETSWVPERITGLRDVSLGFSDGQSEPTVYGVAEAVVEDGKMIGGILVSRDGGRSWENSAGSFEARLEGSRAPKFVAIAACLTDPSTAYVSYNDLRLRNDEVAYHGVAKTVDSGKTWVMSILDATDKPSERINDSWISRRFGRGWGENPFSLGVAPGHPEICYGTDWGRTMRTLNGLESWDAVYSREVSPGFYSTIGLDVTTNYGVHFDPFNPKRVFISYTDIGLFRSEDGGVSWTSSTQKGVPRRWVNTTYWIEFDPVVKGKVWAVMSGVHDLPRPKMWRNRPVSTFNGGVLVSDDGGVSWTVCEGVPQTAATHVVLDTQSPPSSRTLYVAGFGKGVFKSTDGGRTWTLKNKGLHDEEPFAWRLTLDKEGVLYLVVARRRVDGDFGGPGDGYLYRSEDGAETWEKVTLPRGLNGPNGLTLDNEDSNRLYLSAWGRDDSQKNVQGGVWVSSDRGRTWRQTLSEDQFIYDVTVDPRNPARLYACGFQSSAWRSDDRGETWSRIRGYNFKWGHRVIPDPFNAEMLYITTFGGSVWYGPAGGDPDAVEDIETTQAAYSRP